jgi:hypothetical protein
MNDLVGLVHSFSEVIDGLMGEYRDFVLLAESMLVPVWQEIAPKRWRAWYKRLKSHRDWVLMPLSMRGQNLPFSRLSRGNRLC